MLGWWREVRHGWEVLAEESVEGRGPSCLGLLRTGACGEERKEGVREGGSEGEGERGEGERGEGRGDRGKWGAD